MCKEDVHFTLVKSILFPQSKETSISLESLLTPQNRAMWLRHLLVAIGCLGCYREAQSGFDPPKSPLIRGTWLRSLFEEVGKARSGFDPPKSPLKKGGNLLVERWGKARSRSLGGGEGAIIID